MKVADRPQSESAVYTQEREPGFIPRHRAGRPKLRGSDRIVSLTAGSLLTLFGVTRKTIPGFVTAGVGAGLLYRGLTGRSPLSGVVRTVTPKKEARPEDYFERGIHVEEACSINRSPQELYQFWRNFENLPCIMSYLDTVQVVDNQRSHWVAKAPKIAGGKVEWDAEVINDEPDSIIAWRSLSGSDVSNAGSVRFVPGRADRGTEVHVVIDYIPPAGRLGNWVAKLFGENPEQLIREDLRNFKRLMETGETPTIQGQPRGTCTGSGTRHRGA